jgi:hypothetical protein
LRTSGAKAFQVRAPKQVSDIGQGIGSGIPAVMGRKDNAVNQIIKAKPVLPPRIADDSVGIVALLLV